MYSKGTPNHCPAIKKLFGCFLEISEKLLCMKLDWFVMNIILFRGVGTYSKKVANLIFKKLENIMHRRQNLSYAWIPRVRLNINIPEIVIVVWNKHACTRCIYIPVVKMEIECDKSCNDCETLQDYTRPVERQSHRRKTLAKTAAIHLTTVTNRASVFRLHKTL